MRTLKSGWSRTYAGAERAMERAFHDDREATMGDVWQEPDGKWHWHIVDDSEYTT